MLKNVLITSILLLSCNLYAQDSLFVEKTHLQDSEPITNMNNIRYINFDKSYYIYSTILSSDELYKDISPTFLSGILLDDIWNYNWFMDVAVGP
uniref:hypothetical protein n=1 Tax=Bacteroides timonensis TaxID=1470345 RepID=UPI0005C43C02